LVTIGSLTKNQEIVIRVVKQLCARGVEASLDVLGGGRQQGNLEALVGQLGLKERVHIHGRVSHEVVRHHLRAADFAVQAPSVEGFGKVPVEAFFHGAVPILSNVNLSAQLVGHGERGRLFTVGDYAEAAEAIMELSQQPAAMIRMIEQGRVYARSLTLERWREHLHHMLKTQWSVALPRIVSPPDANRALTSAATQP
jgi:glycosyltransferase involved in cell wall biosynthesis